MAVAPGSLEVRGAERKNTLFAADALVGNSRWSVKIRNISQFGAMVETDVKVDAKSAVLIKRGNLHAAGEVVWSHNGVFGIRFFEPTTPDDWLRIRVQEAVPAVEVASDPVQADELPDAVLAQRIVEELGYVERVVATIAGALAEDAILRVRHVARIQELSIAAEMLNQLAAVIASDRKATKIAECVTGSMRQRLLR